MDYCLLLQMNTFGPKILAIFQNFQKLPKWHFFTHAWKSKFFWAKCQVPFSDFIQNMSPAPSICLFAWIKVDKLDFLKIGSRDFKNSFHFGIVWFPSIPGMCQKLRLVFWPFRFRSKQCVPGPISSASFLDRNGAFFKPCDHKSF